MTIFRQIFSKATVQTFAVALFAAVASAGFIMGLLTGDQFIGLATLGFLWAFGRPTAAA